MTTTDPFIAANELAPAPTDRESATTRTWLRHHAAEALAAYAVFREQLNAPGPRVDVIGQAVAHTAAAAAIKATIDGTADALAGNLWDLTPELGDLNGDAIDWLAEVLAAGGINPAAIYRWYEEHDFDVVVAAAADGSDR